MPNDWNSENPPIKEDAAYKFCKELDNDVGDIRNKCKTNTRTARDTLQKAGDFVNMPENLPVYVFEDTEHDSNVMVIMILPEKGKLPPRDQFDIEHAWPCTWTPYAKLLNFRTRGAFLKQLSGAK